MRIGTAGWSISREAAGLFPGEGQHLQRYARVLNCAEINSSFHRSHRVQVYERWAQQTPPGFRFSVKLPRSITHEERLRRARAPLQQFLGEAAGLGDKLAVLLVQLPPSFAFEARQVRSFFGLLADLFAGAVVCEPRHASWFTPTADRVLAAPRLRSMTPGPGCSIRRRGVVIEKGSRGAIRRSRLDRAWLHRARRGRGGTGDLALHAAA